MNKTARNAAVAVTLTLVGCGPSSEGPSQEAVRDGRLGFIGATATPTQMTMSPAGCAASYLFDNMVAHLRGAPVTRPGPGGAYTPGAVTEGPPRPGRGHAVGVFIAPPSIVGKPISITVRGFIAGVNGTTRMSFAGRQSETWTDSATASDPFLAITHTFVAPAVAGENRFELDIALPLEGNDPANASLGIETVDFRVGDVEGCGPDIEHYDQEHPRAG
ncbi:MAG: hypothetical protein K2P58_14055 [Hyphomonadaceae bacterium]|nr:hypothetical protein [Hyphomonadaceae bacterium]